MIKKLLDKLNKKLVGHEKLYLPIFMVSSVFAAIFLVVVSMTIYDKSGAAQLDLSRPGYVTVRAQSITNDNDFKSYSSTGTINQSSINEFKSLYDEQASKAKAVDAFGGDPLSPDALGIDASNPDDSATN